MHRTNHNALGGTLSAQHLATQHGNGGTLLQGTTAVAYVAATYHKGSVGNGPTVTITYANGTVATVSTGYLVHYMG